ncbi:MAG: DUF2723 domain-containing protein [Dysgonamonadaceae bacterium]|jgi:hypothetical protein|nr:DUF2723 domain-containing protein [Dysgonamonadaceae bacterium]
MKKYQWANNILGWIVFVIAAVVYLMTIEPTASFWDCGEFISSAYKLEVGHPPGAPIFMLMGNLASHFAAGPSQVSMMLNALSAIFSALTILFLFWTITHLMRKIVAGTSAAGKQAETSPSQMITILGAGAVGALAYTFSDTFWFSAVEGEVYAFSSLMTAVVFWLILKWEDVADEPHSGRWLILIAYLMGISVAIHLLNLLCIPAIVLVYYFRKTTNPTWKGAAIALFISFVILVAILYGLIQGLVEVAGWFELLFVNGFHLPYNSGVAFYMALILGVLAWAIWETMRDAKSLKRAKTAFILAIALLGIPFIGNGLGLGVCIIIALIIYLFASKKINPVALNTILIGLLVITIGYSSYALIMIRSAANTPMDQNSPEDIFTLRDYLSREQYGETPLFYGQTFVSEVKYENKGNGTLEAVYTDEGPVWGQVAKRDPSEPDRYYEVSRKKHPVYVDELNMLFPRMHSTTGNHVQGYKEWSDFKGRRVRVSTPQGTKMVAKPTFGENLRYFFNYQVNFMYWRYFMWNFSGRQNDIQGNGEVSNGNWITGIPFLDQYRVGPQEDMPDSIAGNKGHNKYYMLPLLLGLLGIFFQVYSGKKGTEQFWITFLLFFMTGLAIVVYLNQPPYQPRERDYAYAGSFYAFCIWIGVGVGAIIRGLQRLKLPDTAAAAVGTALSLLIPLQMVSQTWDDHDRSGRYVARDFGMNYLSTCEPNAIIFTNGDNDTFPLWYAQEVEGYRTDVRVCNLSYLQTDWYIDQMKRQAYESEPLPIDWKKYEYATGKHEVAYVVDEYAEMPVEEVLNRIKSDNARDKRIQSYNIETDNIPTHTIKIPVDSNAVIAAGLVKPENSAWIPSHMQVYLGDQRNENGDVVSRAKYYLGKHEMMILDMLKNNSDWTRPMYFAITVGADMYLRLDPYFRQDGVAYRILPFEAARYQRIDPDVMYDNVMNKYKYGNLEQPGLYLDENCMRMATTFRVIFGRLAQTLADRGDTLRTERVADYCQKVIPSYNVPYDYYSMGEIADAYHKIGAMEKADTLYRQLAEVSMKNLNWYNRLNVRQYIPILEQIRRDIIFMQYIMYYLSKNNTDLFNAYSDEYASYIERFNQITGADQKRQGTRQGGLNR